MSLPRRQQLHSAVNDAGLWFVGVLCVFSVACSVVWLPRSLLRGEPEPMLVVMPLAAVALALAFRWGKRRSSGIYATTAGLHLPGLHRLIPWPEVGVAEDLGMRGGALGHLYRLTFLDGTRPLTFYACCYVDEVVAAFKQRAGTKLKAGSLSDAGGTSGESAGR